MSDEIRVLVFGAAGRMGAEVCRTVAATDGMVLVAAVDPGAPGTTIAEVAGIDGSTGDVGIVAEAGAVDADGVDVAVDFTVAAAARDNIAWCAANGVHAVVGTSGFDAADHDRFAGAFADSACLIAPNFAISAVLMMRFAAEAAPFFDSVEIIELHHDAKRDAPSGTAVATAERIAAASSEWADDPTEDEVLAGARGGRGAGDIPIHAVRLRGLVAHQEVLLGTTGQSLMIRQDSYDRTSFMPGVVAAVRAMAGRTGLIVGLDRVLFD